MLRKEFEYQQTYFLKKEEVNEWVFWLSKNIKSGDWIFLEGDLGAGKTHLVQKLGLSLGCEEDFSSPTFSLMNVFLFKPLGGGLSKLIHMDLYRLNHPNELCFLGLEEEYHPQNSIVICEWPSVVDTDGWKNFFHSTHCLSPERLFKISIDYSSNESDRGYCATLKKFYLD